MSTHYVPEPGSEANFKSLRSDAGLLHAQDKANGPLRQVGPKEPFNRKTSYALWDGDNSVWISFDRHGQVTDAWIYGGSDGENLLDALGDMVSEHDERYAEIDDMTPAQRAWVGNPNKKTGKAVVKSLLK